MKITQYNVYELYITDMLAFVLVFITFYAVLTNRYYTNIQPRLANLSGKGIIPFPTKLVTSWILVTNTLFPMQAIMKARQANWTLDSSLSAMALVLGIVLGLSAQIDIE